MSIKVYNNRIVIPSTIKLSNMYENRSKNIELQLHEEAIPALFESIKEIE